MTAPIVTHYGRAPYSPNATPRPYVNRPPRAVPPGQLWERVDESRPNRTIHGHLRMHNVRIKARLYHDEQVRGSLTKSGPRVRNYEYATAASGIIRAGVRVK